MSALRSVFKQPIHHETSMDIVPVLGSQIFKLIEKLDQCVLKENTYADKTQPVIYKQTQG